MYTVLDFETTGLKYEEHQVIQIGAVKLDKSLEEIGSYSTYVKLNKGHKLPQLITNITGIKKKDLITGLSENTALNILNQFIGDSVVVAQYASFDLGFMSGEESPNFLCTKSVFNLLYKGQKAGLKDITGHYEIPYDNHHDALYDAVMTVEILKRLQDDLKEKNGEALEDYHNVMTEQNDRPLRFIPAKAKVIKIKK